MNMRNSTRLEKLNYKVNEIALRLEDFPLKKQAKVQSIKEAVIHEKENSFNTKWNSSTTCDGAFTHEKQLFLIKTGFLRAYNIKARRTHVPPGVDTRNYYYSTSRTTNSHQRNSRVQEDSFERADPQLPKIQYQIKNYMNPIEKYSTMASDMAQRKWQLTSQLEEIKRSVMQEFPIGSPEKISNEVRKRCEDKLSVKGNNIRGFGLDKRVHQKEREINKKLTWIYINP